MESNGESVLIWLREGLEAEAEKGAPIYWELVSEAGVGGNHYAVGTGYVILQSHEW